MSRATYAGAGAYLVVRRARNLICWLLIATGTGLFIGTTRPRVTPEQLLDGGLDPLTAAAAWANGWGWGVALLLRDKPAMRREVM